METSILPTFAQYGPAVLIMALMIWWFSKQIDKKDLINQENLNRFIAITEKYSALSEKVAAHLDSNIAKLGEHHLTTIEKLDAIHDEIKRKKCLGKVSE